MFSAIILTDLPAVRQAPGWEKPRNNYTRIENILFFSARTYMYILFVQRKVLYSSTATDALPFCAFNTQQTKNIAH